MGSSIDARLAIGPEVEDALREGRPVVALESTLISHGLPYPQNLEVATASEAAVREAGAVPATVAIRDGRLLVGLGSADLEALAEAPAGTVRKAARPSLALALGDGGWAATTVSATMIAAHAAGVRVFATGPGRGVHRHHDAPRRNSTARGARWPRSRPRDRVQRRPVRRLHVRALEHRQPSRRGRGVRIGDACLRAAARERADPRVHRREANRACVSGRGRARRRRLGARDRSASLRDRRHARRCRGHPRAWGARLSRQGHLPGILKGTRPRRLPASGGGRRVRRIVEAGSDRVETGPTPNAPNVSAHRQREQYPQDGMDHAGGGA